MRFAQAAEHVKGILCVEMNTGTDDRGRKACGKRQGSVEFYGTVGGFVPTPDAVVDFCLVKKLKEGK